MGSLEDILFKAVPDRSRHETKTHNRTADISLPEQDMSLLLWYFLLDLYVLQHRENHASTLRMPLGRAASASCSACSCASVRVLITFCGVKRRPPESMLLHGSGGTTIGWILSKLQSWSCTKKQP